MKQIVGIVLFFVMFVASLVLGDLFVLRILHFLARGAGNIDLGSADNRYRFFFISLVGAFCGLIVVAGVFLAIYTWVFVMRFFNTDEEIIAFLDRWPLRALHKTAAWILKKN